MIFCVFVRILAGVLIEGYLAVTIRLKVSGCSLAPSLNVPEIADAVDTPLAIAQAM